MQLSAHAQRDVLVDRIANERMAERELCPSFLEDRRDAFEARYAAVRRSAGRKPVVVVMGELAASGGYVAAIAADHIVARGVFAPRADVVRTGPG